MHLNLTVPPASAEAPSLTARERAAMQAQKEERSVADPNYVRDIIRMEEGVRSRVYIDTKWSKKPTIGVGFNMNRKSARRKFQEIGADWDQVRKGRRLDDDQIDHLFDLSLTDAYRDVKSVIKNFDMLAPSRQAALVDLAFNIGRKKFKGFTNMIKGVNRGDFEFAAKHIMKSEYAKQLPARAARNYNRMLMPMSEFVPPPKRKSK